MVYRLAVRAMAAVRATPTPTPLLMRRMMPLRLPADVLRRIAGCPLKNRWMPQLCRVTQLLEQRRITICYNSYNGCNRLEMPQLCRVTQPCKQHRCKHSNGTKSHVAAD